METLNSMPHTTANASQLPSFPSLTNERQTFYFNVIGLKLTHFDMELTTEVTIDMASTL